MLVLPNEIFLKICTYLNIYNYTLLPRISKRARDSLNITIKKYILEREFHPLLLNVFGIDNLIYYPVLEWNKHFMGKETYIDNILPRDMNDSIMIGRDLHNRYFICIRLNTGTRQNTEVIFQKYLNSKAHWTYSNGYARVINAGGYIIDNDKIKDKDLKRNINVLQNGGYVTLNSETRDTEYIELL